VGFQGSAHERPKQQRHQQITSKIPPRELPRNPLGDYQRTGAIELDDLEPLAIQCASSAPADGFRHNVRQHGINFALRFRAEWQ
jgi:hypothetical protein